MTLIAAEELRRLQGQRTGQDLIAVLQASPHRDINLHTAPAQDLPVQDVGHGLTLVSRDTGGLDKTGVRVVNPWKG